MNNISKISKNKCNGCSACYNSCLKNAILMVVFLLKLRSIYYLKTEQFMVQHLILIWKLNTLVLVELKI